MKNSNNREQIPCDGIRLSVYLNDIRFPYSNAFAWEVTEFVKALDII